MAENGNYHIYIHQTKEVIHKHVHTQKISSSGKETGGTRSSGVSGEKDLKRIPSQIPGSSLGNAIISGVKKGGVGGTIGIVVAVAKAVEQAQKACGKLAEQTASATGDYTFTTTYNNMAQTQHNIMHPLTSYIKAQETEASWLRASRRTEEQRSLLGDSALNTLTKGV